MKTLYTVDYTGIGYGGTFRRVFENLEDAKRFARRDYADPVVIRNYKNENAERIIEEAKLDGEFGYDE